MSNTEPLSVADVIKLAGGRSAVAAALGIHRTSTYWTEIPPVHVPRLAALAGVDPARICPAMYEGINRDD